MTFSRLLIFIGICFTVTGCVAGRNPSAFNQSFFVESQFENSNVTIIESSKLPCSKTIKKSENGPYKLISVGGDFFVLVDADRKRIVAPLSSACFEL